MNDFATNPRMLVVMPYWDGDKNAALDSALLAADLLTRKSDDTGFMFVYRNDSSPPSSLVIQRMREKFGRVDSWKCDRKGVGFPMGPNEMYLGIFSCMVNRKFNFNEFDFIFIMESDVVVTRPDWHFELIEEWKKTVAEQKNICGTFHPTAWGGYPEHVNASALYDRKIVKRLPELVGCDGNVGWDWRFGSSTIPVARNSPLFKLDYSRPTIDADTLLASPALVYHGVKDESARKIIRDNLVLSSPATRVMTPDEYARFHGYSATQSITEPGTWILKKL